MKYRINISALLLAALIFVSGNGFALFEHICNTTKSHSFHLFSEPTCELETKTASCCEKSHKKASTDCCSKKQFFSKLSVEGFIAKQLFLKSSLEKELKPLFFTSDITVHYGTIHQHISGLPPPDNLYRHAIKSHLQPTLTELQVFRC